MASVCPFVNVSVSSGCWSCAICIYTQIVHTYMHTNFVFVDTKCLSISISCIAHFSVYLIMPVYILLYTCTYIDICAYVCMHTCFSHLPLKLCRTLRPAMRRKVYHTESAATQTCPFSVLFFNTSFLPLCNVTFETCSKNIHEYIFTWNDHTDAYTLLTFNIMYSIFSAHTHTHTHTHIHIYDICFL